MGPIIIDIEGQHLTEDDKALLSHPNVGGVILFARNYTTSTQLSALTASINASRETPLVIFVDQEGGRVQRFREGFTKIPPASVYQYQEDGDQLAYDAGWLMATELIAHGVDTSFAPVLDIGEQCAAIGNRAFGKDIETVTRYAKQFSLGMKAAGMATTGKHFPGHGGVLADSHLETPHDPRNDIQETDMQVFQTLIEEELLDCIMPAHVVYDAYDDRPASGSDYWLKKVLRNTLKYPGIVFSDDLNMKGADVMGSYAERAVKALEAGCDALLLCNNRQGLLEMVEALPQQDCSQLGTLKTHNQDDAIAQMQSDRYTAIKRRLATLS
ncbi:beta-N-acetylhexosaminidase [Thaumasiovibrio subtropicus]|uniref:beta-N-acetylhexosaminidase n=1 Tax=Thaumasiovibrio subtropicus TaxID=1891207 RepID=UPI000B354B1B|nr:beta-N-acetylhexosaminidase [Thaumasiovibrio subtropicus]